MPHMKSLNWILVFIIAVLTTAIIMIDVYYSMGPFEKKVLKDLFKKFSNKWW